MRGAHRRILLSAPPSSRGLFSPRTRRQFLADVGRGALVASLGSAIAGELFLGTARADDVAPPLDFGPLEELVVLLQETPADHVLPLAVKRLSSGTDLKTLVAAAALANARTFGGEDYIGFHTMMALPPAYHMALASPEATRALPVLKVLYRNSDRLGQVGGRSNEVLRTVAPTAVPAGTDGATALRAAVRAKDVAAAEATFAGLAPATPESLLSALLVAVEDEVEVHRVVLPYRAYEMASLVGPAYAATLLRQSVRYCVHEETRPGDGRRQALRTLLPSLLAEHGLLDRAAGKDPVDDGWVELTSRSMFEATPEAAAEIAAEALAKGKDPAAVGEAIVLAANQLVLRDAGRPEREAKANKPVGSVHGDSIGVHASDSANAWRNLSRAGGPRHVFSCLILGAYQVARDRVSRGGDFLAWKPRPLPEDLEGLPKSDPEALLREAEGAIREQRQGRACAAVHRYGEEGFPARPVIDLLLRYGTTSDGALHAEKYFRTATEEFEAGRPAFRWRHLEALARVTASESGSAAAGVEEAARLLRG